MKKAIVRENKIASKNPSKTEQVPDTLKRKMRNVLNGFLHMFLISLNFGKKKKISKESHF